MSAAAASSGRPPVGPLDLLTGVRVIDFSALLPGPLATQILADFGAEVIKVERPGGDPMREMMPGAVESVNRGKRSVVLDLKSAAGREIAHGLVAGAQVVVESARPGVAQRLGIDYETLSELNPDLVYCSLSGYGQTGPRRLEPGHDLNFAAMAGAYAGNDSGSISLLPIGDTLSGTSAAAAILAALHSGRGAYIDVSIAESVLAAMGSLISEHVARGRPRPADFPLRPAYGLYDTSDAAKLCVACTEDHFWQRLCEVLDLARLGGDPGLAEWEGRARRSREIDAAIAARVARRPLAEWQEAFRDADLPVTEVNQFEPLLGEPQFLARSAFVDTRGAGYAAVGFPALVDGRRPAAVAPPSAPGADAESVLGAAGQASSEGAEARGPARIPGR